MDTSSFSKKKKKRSKRGRRNITQKKEQKVGKKESSKICEKKGEQKVCIKKFPNGMTFLYEPSLNPSLGLSCICLFVNIGSSKEPEHLKGVSHLIEHMMFKATKKYSQDKLLSIFDSTGSKFNAYTNKCLTCFYIICETKYMKDCLDAFAEMVIHAIFDKKETEKEQKVVYEENIQDKDDATRLLHDGVDMALFEGTPYAKPVDFIHGPLNRKMVMDYYFNHYLPTNMVLSIVSSDSYHAVEHIISKNPITHFRRPLEIETPIIKAIQPMKYNGDSIYTKYQTSDGIKFVYYNKTGIHVVQIAIGFRSCPWKEVQDREIMKLIKLLFSRGMNGRLFNELRKKYGLAYSPSAGSEYYDVMGKFGIYTEIESSKLIQFREKGKVKKGVLPIVLRLLHDFIEKGPTLKEWQDVKGYCHGEEMIAMEKINHLAEYNGRNYWLSEWQESEEKGTIDSSRIYWEKYIEHSNLQDCKACIAKYFRPSNMCITLVGNGLPSFSVLEKCVAKYF